MRRQWGGNSIIAAFFVLVTAGGVSAQLTEGLEPQPPGALTEVAYMALESGRLDEAGRVYDAALADDPRDASAWLGLGITRELQGRPDEAERYYRDAIAAQPSDASPYRALARLLVSRGETEEAKQLLERVPKPSR